MPRRVLPLLLLVPLCACAGLGGTEEPRPLRVSLLDHTGGQCFELVNEAHTSGVEYYSVAREAASLKVIESEILEALIEELDRQGLARFAKAGAAPGVGTPREGTITRSLEVERGGRREQWSVGTGSDPQERLAFHQCSSTLLQVYNLAQAYQTIENPEGAALFQQPQHGR